MQATARTLSRSALAGLALALLTLLVWREPDYDPTAWLIWGRQLTDGTLSMIGAPSWKPLPVAFTTLFAFAGDELAPLLWLVVARVSAIVALGLAYVIARRLGGRWSGVLAAAGLGLATDFLFNGFRGDSEGLLVALVLGAVLAGLAGRRWAGFTLLVLAAGLRPEVWPLLAAAGAWIAWRDRRLVIVALVAAGGVVVLAAWFLPDYLSTGDWFRGAGRAQNPVDGSPAQSAFPFGLTLVFAAGFLPWPLYAGAAYAGRRAWRSRRTFADGAVLLLVATAAFLLVLIGVMAELGFTGNIRYATLPGALLAVAGGVGLPPLVAAGRERLRPWQLRAAAGAAGVAVLVSLVVVGDGAGASPARSARWATGCARRSAWPAARRTCARVVACRRRSSSARPSPGGCTWPSATSSRTPRRPG